MWSPNELLKIEKQRDILSYITLQFFHFKKVPLEHCPLHHALFVCFIFCLSFILLFSCLQTPEDPPAGSRRPGAGVPASPHVLLLSDLPCVHQEQLPD